MESYIYALATVKRQGRNVWEIIVWKKRAEGLEGRLGCRLILRRGIG